MRLDMPKSVEKVIVLHANGPMTVHRKKDKKRKESKELKPISKLARTAARAQEEHAKTLRKANSKSGDKKKDGALKDYTKNQNKAMRASAKVWKRAYA